MLLEEFAFSSYPREQTLRFLVAEFDRIRDRINDTAKTQTMLKTMFKYMTGHTRSSEIVKPLLRRLRRMEGNWHDLVLEIHKMFKQNADNFNSARPIFEAWLAGPTPPPGQAGPTAVPGECVDNLGHGLKCEQLAGICNDPSGIGPDILCPKFCVNCPEPTTTTTTTPPPSFELCGPLDQ
ncbi:hypothetical protein ACOMHN_053980 [Nucella lapillus]